MSVSLIKKIAAGLLVAVLCGGSALADDAWGTGLGLRIDLPMSSFGWLNPLSFSAADQQTTGPLTFSGTYTDSSKYHELRLYPSWEGKERHQNGLSMVPRDWPVEVIMTWVRPVHNNGYWSLATTYGAQTQTFALTYHLHGLTAWTPPGAYTFKDVLKLRVQGCRYVTWAPGKPMWAHCEDLGTVDSAPLTVTLFLGRACQIEAAALSFGTVSLAQPNYASTGITARCTKGMPYKITLSAGASGNSFARAMRKTTGAGTLPYYLYSDSARSVALAGSTGIYGVGTGNPVNVPIFGTVPPGRAASGDYADALVMTIEY